MSTITQREKETRKMQKQNSEHTLRSELGRIGFKVRKVRWPRAKYGTKGVTRREAGIKNLHFTMEVQA